MFDIVFISYNEPNADANWKALVSRFPYARRINGVKGIHQAHKTAANCFGISDMFWVVDGDTEVLEDFDFKEPEGVWDQSAYVYKSQNPINGLTYGNGGIKLIPRYYASKITLDLVDMTTSMAPFFTSIDIIAGVTRFNTDPFNTWRSAFRECVKLSSKIIDKQVDTETEERLNIWCTLGKEQAYGEWCIKGSHAGRAYGISNIGNVNALKKINEFDWLKDIFDIQQIK